MNKTASCLEAVNIKKSFGKRKVLEGINLNCIPKKIYGIVGENGSGKSTLLNILTGFLKADEGKVITKATIGYCPQVPYVFENLTVQENLKLFGNAYGLSTIETLKTGITLCEKFRCKKYLKIRTSELSSGTKQKLNLILSLLHNPDILFLDEPYAAFDWETYLIFWEYTTELKKAGKTVILVSHLIYDLEKLDEIKQLDNGVLK